MSLETKSFNENKDSKAETVLKLEDKQPYMLVIPFRSVLDVVNTCLFFCSIKTSHDRVVALNIFSAQMMASQSFPAKWSGDL